MKDKINRFIEMLAKRNDPALNKFFYEIAQGLQPLMRHRSIMDEDNGFLDYQNAKLKYENEKLTKMLNLFCAESVDDISDNELLELEKFSQGNYYTAKSFFDTSSKIRSVKSMMRIFYPNKTNFANTIEELTKGEIHLNKKLWDLTQN